MSRSVGEDGEAVDRLSGDILEVRLRFFGCRRRRTVMNVRPGRSTRARASMVWFYVLIMVLVQCYVRSCCPPRAPIHRPLSARGRRDRQRSAPRIANAKRPLSRVPSQRPTASRRHATPIAFARGQATAPAGLPIWLGANVTRSSRNAIPQKQYPYSSTRVTPTCGMPRIVGRLSLASRNIRSAPDDAHFELPCTASFLVLPDSRNHHAHIEIPLVAT
jgi:hypothetical protein